jgi:hypothetical protein
MVVVPVALHAGVDSAAQHGGHGVAVAGVGVVALRRAHAAQADRGDAQARIEGAFVHENRLLSGLGCRAGLVGRGVLLVGDGLEPGGAVAVLDAFEHGEVAHHAVDAGAVPVLLTGRSPDCVAGG